MAPGRKSYVWGRRADKKVDVVECVYEILFYEAPYLLGLAIVSIVIAGRQCVSPDQDAPFYFFAEPLGPGAFI